MTEKVEAYKASDGTLYDTERQCNKHETSLKWREKIDAFCMSEFCDYKSGAHRGIANKVIVGWEEFKVKYGEEK